MDSRTAPSDSPSNKRPRSPTGDQPPPVSKVPKTQTNHLHINYLARQYQENLPLVSTDDSLHTILRLIGEYDGVLQRHESIAGNLGACPLGPILMKRFERLFDGPPRVLKSHSKDGGNVTWLDVIEFAKNKPEQFNLERTRNGVRVCQFYTKQCRVEISEEDYVLIASGMPQKLIPQQPIDEDEEKELGALEILEKNLQQIIQMADSAAARARQLTYRLRNRRNAIASRREMAMREQQRNQSTSPARHDGMAESGQTNGHPGYGTSYGPSTGFVAVNSMRPGDDDPSSQFMRSHPNTDNITIINGTSIKGASPQTRAELMKKFFTTSERQARGYPDGDAPATSNSRGGGRSRARDTDSSEHGGYGHAAGAVPIPNTPSSLLPQPKSSHQNDRDDGGPFKMEMVARMEQLQRGMRILPPCDRCRRLQMDCLKNLTACQGCTKKHAKCSWKEVKEEELRQYPIPSQQTDDSAQPQDTRNGGSRETQRNEKRSAQTAPKSPPNNNISNDSRRAESAPSAPVPSASTNGSSSEHHRAASDPQTRPPMSTSNDTSRRRRQSNAAGDDDDGPDSESRLMQAILDTVAQHDRMQAAKKEQQLRQQQQQEQNERQPREDSEQVAN